MLTAIFTCCLSRRQSPAPGDPREQEHLIPREPQHTTIDDATTRRQREIQDRLTRIVRAKEGKMVNLHSRLPFNLHNRNLSASTGTGLDPSTSRSASDSLIASPNSPRYPITYAITQPPNFYSSPLADSRRPSGSRSSSAVTRPEDVEGELEDDHHHLVGGDRVHQDMQGRGHSEQEEVEGEHILIDDRIPILNLRLVNPVPSIINAHHHHHNHNNRPMLTRGRSATKQAVGGGEDPRIGLGLAPGLNPGPQIIPPQLLLPKLDSEDVISPTSTVMPNTITPPEPHDAPSTTLLDTRLTPNGNFKFQETQPLVLNWEL